MRATKKAKLFKNGASQAVRLPAEFRFEGDEVYISRDKKTQNVVLSTQPGAQVWDEFFAFVRGIDIPPDWMKERHLNRLMMDEEEPLFREDD